MAKKLYALLVGINEYNNPGVVSNLKGCVNDVLSVEKKLKQEYASYDLNIKKLLNSEATHAGVIDGFQNHLANAGKDDVVFFHYSGHGARQKAAPEFSKFFSEDYQETLVCFDSRREGGYDLADKELAALLHQVAENDPHITVVLDCCHSGSGTRNDSPDFFILGASRQTESRHEERSLATYLNGYYSKQLENGGEIKIPKSKHILLSACDRRQEAKETLEHSGVFTTALLTKFNKNITYADLFLETRKEIVKMAIDQTPQFEPYEYFDAKSKFLNPYDTEKSAGMGEVYEVFHKEGLWQIPFGAMAGLSTAPEKSYDFVLFDAKETYLSDEKKIGNATTTLVRAEYSDLDLKELATTTDKVYQAKLISLPPAQLLVCVEASDDDFKKLQAQKPPYLFVDFVRNVKKTQYTLQMTDDQILLVENGTEKQIQGSEGNNESSLEYIFEVIDQIVNWERLVALDNASTKIDDDAVELNLYEKINGEEFLVEAKEAKFLFEGKDIEFEFRVKSKLKQRLYYALLYASESYGIYEVSKDILEPSDQEVTINADVLYLEEGDEKAMDRFQLIVSTENIDAFLITKDDLEFGKIQSLRGEARSVGKFRKAEAKKITNDWITRHLFLETVRQNEEISEKDLKIGDSITIEKHDDFRGRVKMGTIQASRSINAMQAIPDIAKHLDCELINFNKTDLSENVMEISGIQNEDKLAENPLEIRMNLDLQENEYLFPLAFDGEDFVPVGMCENMENGNTQLLIDKLPETQAVTRSLGKTIKLTFLKLIGKKRGLQELRWLDLEKEKLSRLTTDLKQKVSESKKVMLLIHGVFGDTDEMSKGLRSMAKEKGYLVLTFDYENLNTPLQDTAKKLYKELIENGFDEKDNRELVIVAHSFGGLIARYLVEKLKGNKFVDQLILLGVPNNGSVFDSIMEYRGIATTIITVLVGLPTLIAAAPAVISAAGGVLLGLNQSKKISKTMEQSTEDSEFMNALNANDDPKIQYTVISGDLDIFLAKEGNELKSRFEKIQKKVGSMVFGEEPNDMLVDLGSMKKLNILKKIAPIFETVAAHHLNYFDNKDSLEVISKHL